MESEEGEEIKTSVHKNLIRTESLQDPDGSVTIRDYNEYVCRRRKRAAIIGVVVILFVAAATFTAVYLLHIHPKLSKNDQLGDCSENQVRFKTVDKKCFMYRDVQSIREILFKGNAEGCMKQCFSQPACLSVDFFSEDGECWMFTVTSDQVLYEWTDSQKLSQLDVEQRRKLKNCVHYDRTCM